MLLLPHFRRPGGPSGDVLEPFLERLPVNVGLVAAAALGEGFQRILELLRDSHKNGRLVQFPVDGNFLPSD